MIAGISLFEKVARSFTNFLAAQFVVVIRFSILPLRYQSVRQIFYLFCVTRDYIQKVLDQLQFIAAHLQRALTWVSQKT